jgi:hypothetical protein
MKKKKARRRRSNTAEELLAHCKPIPSGLPKKPNKTASLRPPKRLL